MRIKIDLKIFIFVILFYFTKQIELYAMLMLFALLHEGGHLIAGLCMGFKAEKLNIMPVGVSISLKIPIENYNTKVQNSNLLAIKKIIIASSGPIVNILIAMIFLFISFGLSDLQRLNIIYANIIICIFNLLPIYPLDGGRILKQILKLKCGLLKSIKYTHIIQNTCLIFLTIIFSITIFYFKNIAFFIIDVYLWILLISENKKYAVRSKIYEYIK